jgi:hypothetical protein
MRRLSHSILAAMLVGAFASCAGATQQPKTAVNADAAALQEFKQRVDAYVALHKQAESKTAAPKETTDTAKIQASRDMLAAAIQSMRKTAKPGDVFTPAVRTRIRTLLNPEFKGKGSTDTKELMSEDMAAGIPLKVNGKYPDTATVTTMPPNVLKQLPVLPEGLEYRIVGSTLILRDVDANLIVDYMTGAIPVAIRKSDH